MEFAVLFGALLAALLLVRREAGRRLLVLGVSCVFYGWADWRFLALLGVVTVVDYSIAKAIAGSDAPRFRRWLLAGSVATNLGLLFVFKYFGFFTANLARLGVPVTVLEIALPVGISFYTFETLSYVIDVYRGTAEPARSLLDYAVFITFFPRLVAGPIMRARQFLPQLESGVVLSLDNFAAGAQLFALGAVKKMVFADGAAVFVDNIYQYPKQFSPLAVWLAVFCYSIQILCDFSGYTDMAMGLARILGIQLPPNFALPYTAQSLTEFWQRWHISLSTWLRDYLYIPLGGNRSGTVRTYVNLMVTMLLGGLWHGANWNFLAWGGLHGFYLVVERRLWGGRLEPAPWTSPWAWVRATGCFLVVSLTWVFFRSPGLAATVRIWKKLLFLDNSGVFWVFWPGCAAAGAVIAGGLLSRLFAVEIRPLPARSPLLPAALLLAAVAVLVLMPVKSSPFIYFRF